MTARTGILTQFFLDAFGDIHQNGPFSSGGSKPECFRQYKFQLLHFSHDIAMFDDGLGDADDVYFLKTVSAQQGNGHVAGDRHHGYGIQVRIGDAGDQVGGAGTAGGNHHPRFSCHSGISVGGMSSPLLMGGNDMLDPVGIPIQLIVNIEYGTARITKDGFDAVFDQFFHQYLCSAAVHCAFILLSYIRKNLTAFAVRSFQEFYFHSIHTSLPAQRRKALSIMTIMPIRKTIRLTNR